jgi:hypothetical protein
MTPRVYCTTDAIRPRSRIAQKDWVYAWPVNTITSLPSAQQIATGAIKRSVQNVTRDASVVANSQNITSANTVEALIDSRQQLLYVKAAAKIITVADEMTESLIDTHA